MTIDPRATFAGRRQIFIAAPIEKVRGVLTDALLKLKAEVER